MTWSEYADAAQRTASGLRAVGVESDDSVALLMGNRPEWQVCDMGALLAGATPFSLYATAPADQNVDLLQRAGARVLIAEAALLDGLVVPDGITVITLDDGAEDVLTLADLQHQSARLPELRDTGGGIATLIFTSGTTGPPKAVEIDQEGIRFMAEALHRIRPLTDGRHISYLPHAHIVDRLVGHYLPLLSGATTTTVANPMSIFDHLPSIRPTFFTSVPRIWQRLETQLRNSIAALDPGERDEVIGTIETADPGAAVGAGRHGWLAGIREELGLDAADWLLTGSAPLARETHRFFAGIGMPLHDCWGLSETLAVATVMPPDDHRIGTVGRPLPGTEVRIADDGEVLVRGPHLTRQYRGDPTATAAAIDDDGWFHSGDLGRWDGTHLALVGRKKEMMISSGGENMSPIRIESVLSSSSALIKDVVVVGDGRPFNVALVVPDLEVAATQLGPDVAAPGSAGRAALKAAVAGAVRAANEQLTRAESIRDFLLLDRDWSVTEGEITPTLKLRRSSIESKFAERINELYP